MTSPLFKVLVFSRTASYRHNSIPAGISGIHRLAEDSIGSATPFTAFSTEDPSIFTPSSLSEFRVIILLQCSGEFLSSPDQLDALKGFVRSGGGIVGIHCASFGMLSSEWYGRLIGAVFDSHPEPQKHRVRVVDAGHPIVARSLGKSAGMRELGGDWEWEWMDEWYMFKEDAGSIKENVHVLLTGGLHDQDYPIAWCHEFQGGRSFYTSLGHFDEAFEDEGFMAQVLGGILWVSPGSRED